MTLPLELPAGFRNDGCGPFQSSTGNVYYIHWDLVNTTTVDAWKASDPTSSWSKIAEKSGFAGTPAPIGLDVYRVGDVLHIVASDGASDANRNYKYFTFDMSTDAFSASVETIISGVDTGGSWSNFASICVRSGGEVVVLYNSAKVKSQGTYYGRLSYKRRTAPNTWSAAVGIDAGGSYSYIYPSCCVGASDRVHFFFTRQGFTRHRSLSSDNVLDTVYADDTHSESYQFDPVVWTVGSDVRVCVHCTSGIYYFISGANPSISFVTAANAGLSSSRTGGLALDGSDLWCLSDLATGYWHARKSTDYGATWGSDAVDGALPETYGSSFGRRNELYTLNDNRCHGFCYYSYVDYKRYWQHVLLYGPQTLSPSRFDDADTFYDATVGPDLYVDQQQRFTDADAFYSPAVGTWPADITSFFVHGNTTTRNTVGPFPSSDGNLFIFGVDATSVYMTTAHVRAIKASQDDPASWTASDLASGYKEIREIIAAQRGDYVHLIVPDVGTSGGDYNYKYLRFDMSSETFDTAETIASITGFGGPQPGMSSIAVRSTGEPVTVFEVVGSGGVTEVAYSRRAGANNWTTPVILSDGSSRDNVLPVAVLGAEDRIHFGWSYLSGNPVQVWQRCLGSDNVLHDATTLVNWTWNLETGISFEYPEGSGNIRCVFWHTNFYNVTYYDSEDTPTIHGSSLYAHGLCALYAKEGKLYAIYTSTDGPTLHWCWRTSLDGGDTWSAENSIRTSTSPSSTEFIGRGVMYSDTIEEHIAAFQYIDDWSGSGGTIKHDHKIVARKVRPDRFDDADVSYSASVSQPFPITITGLATDVAPLGVFKSSAGNYYFLGKSSSSATTIAAYKSSEPGTDPFANVASKSGYATAIVDVRVTRRGDVLHFCVCDGPATSANVKYLTFDMSTDAFGADETIASGMNTQSQQHGMLTARSDGSVVAIFNGARTQVGGIYYSRVYYSRRTGTDSWTSPTQLDDNGSMSYSTGVCALGASDRVHFFWLGHTSSWTSWTQSIDSGNNLDTRAQFGSTWSENSFNAAGASIASFDYGANRRIVLVHSAPGDGVGNVTHAFNSAANATLLSEGTIYYGGYPVRLVVDDDTPAAPVLYEFSRMNLFSDPNYQYVVYDRSFDGGETWEADWPEEMLPTYWGPVAGQWPNSSLDGEIYIRDDVVIVALIVNDSGTHKYHEKQLHPKKQTLAESSRFSDADAFYQATISQTEPGQLLYPLLFDDAATFYSPTVQRGAVTVSQGARFSDAEVFYAPSVAQSLVATLFDDADAFYQPTVTASRQLDLLRFDDSDVFYSSTLSLVVLPQRLDDSDVFYSPTLAPAASPIRFDDSDVFYSPTLSLVALPQLFSDAGAFYSPTICVVASPLRFDDADLFYAADVQRGAVSVSPQLFGDADAFYSLTISLDLFDDYWSDVVLLAGFDQAIVDESLFQRGPADAEGTAQVFSGAPLMGDASLLLAGPGDYASWISDTRLSVADASDKTIEFRFELDSLDEDRPLIDKGEYKLEVLVDGALRFRTYVDGVPDAEIATAAGTISAGVQYYAALCRQAGAWKLFCGSGPTVDLVGSDDESAQPTLSDHALKIG